MKTPPLASPRCLVLAALSALAGGCVGPVATDTRRPFVGADYEQIYVTGSHIPVLVPKSPTARRLPGISPLMIITPDDIRRQGHLPMH